MTENLRKPLLWDQRVQNTEIQLRDREQVFTKCEYLSITLIKIFESINL